MIGKEMANGKVLKESILAEYIDERKREKKVNK